MIKTSMRWTSRSLSLVIVAALFLQMSVCVYAEEQEPDETTDVYASDTIDTKTEEAEDNVVEVYSAGVIDVTSDGYGAKGDGTTDDREAIQKAIDAAAANGGGGTVYFPAGTYKVDEILQLKSNITLSLDDNATILNGINIAGHPSIVFMTGPFTDDGQQVEWADVENIKIIGGTIDMNGTLNEDGTACKNLNAYVSSATGSNGSAGGSTGGIALGYATNVTIQNVTFLDSYAGHAIQVCACKDVLIEGCSFKGQNLPTLLKDGGRITKESLQIEPSTTNGFPYATNNTGKASENITIRNCYFGKSENSGELVTGIGTHNQVPTVTNNGVETPAEKCKNIVIEGCTFDNMMYAGVRFCGFEDVEIRNNTFIKKTQEESINYRTGGAMLINIYCYNNKSAGYPWLDLNKRITITGNKFSIADPNTRSIRAAKDNVEYKGDVTDITITNNTIINTAEGHKQMAIQAYLLTDNLTITGNTIKGGKDGIKVESCTGKVTINNNDLSDLSGEYMRFKDGGDAKTIHLYVHDGCGTLDISTAGENYTITAVPNKDYGYVGCYKETALTTLVDTEATHTIPINGEANLHPLFKPKSIVTVSGNLSKTYDGAAISTEGLTTTVQRGTGEITFKFYSDAACTNEIEAPAAVGSYWVKALIAADEEYLAGESTPLAFTIRSTSSSDGGSSSGGGSSSDDNSSSTTTTKTNNADGSTTTTVTDKRTGAVTETTKHKDGTTVTVETPKSGTPTTKVDIPVSVINQANRSNEVVTLPIPAVQVTNSGTPASTVTVNLPSNTETAVKVPVVNPTPGTVAVIVDKDGKEQIVKTSVPVSDGLVIPLSEGATLVIKDNSKDFHDINSESWFGDAVEFVSARGLFSGTSRDTFSPDLNMSRGMLAVVLHNLENNPSHAGNIDFQDVDAGAWYTEAVQWAAERGIVSGYGNGNFGANDSINREQLAVMLWRHAGSPKSQNQALNFQDANEASGYAVEALKWASENGIMAGNGHGVLAPRSQATRAQVAQMLMSYISYMN